MNGKGLEFAVARQVFAWATVDSTEVFSSLGVL